MNTALESLHQWGTRRVRGLLFTAWFVRIIWRTSHGEGYVFRGVPTWVVRRYLNCGTETWESAAADELAMRLIRLARSVPRPEAAAAAEGVPQP